MKSVLVVVSVLALAHHAFATSCSGIQEYNTTLKPACYGNDVFVLWPNYENFAQYYRCQGAGNPVLVDCAADTYFSYYLQICNACADFIPAPVCEELRTVNPPVCVKIESATTAAPTTDTTTMEPTTAESTTTESTTTESTTTESTTTESTTTESTTTESTTPEPTTVESTTPEPTTTESTTPEPTTQEPTTTAIPMPPSPSTAVPGVSTPPTPIPTPPSVEVTPPSQSRK